MKNIVIVDIDGTISKVGDRLKYLQMKNPDWDKFYNSCFDDEPIKEICEMIERLSHFYNIIYCTGRRESVRKKTIEWINKHIYSMRIFDPIILMRPDGDERHDVIVKPEQLKKHGIDFDEIAFILEDRNSMVAKWREMGLKCLQVAIGEF